jgi:hypothetical protein
MLKMTAINTSDATTVRRARSKTPPEERPWQPKGASQNGLRLGLA